MSMNPTCIVSIASGKGGVGKTTVAVNLAWALAERQKDVCLLDADMGLANVDILLGLNPRKTLEDVLFQGLPMREATINVRDKVDVISGSSGVSRMAELSRERRTELVKDFSGLNRYDFLLIDNSPGISAQVISLCSASRDIVMVVIPEATSLTDSYALIKVLKENGLWWNPLILVNRAKGPRQAMAVYERIREATQKFLRLDCRYLGWIAEDVAVHESIIGRRPVVELIPHAAASGCFLSVADKLVEHSQSKGRSVSPETFWDQSVTFLQQRPLVDSVPPELRTYGEEEQHTAEQAEDTPLGPELDRIGTLAESLRACPDPSSSGRVVDEIKAVLVRLRRYEPQEMNENETHTDTTEHVDATGNEAGENGSTEEQSAAPVKPDRVLLICPHAEMQSVILDVLHDFGYEVDLWDRDQGPVPGENYRLVLISWDRADAPIQQLLDEFRNVPVVLLAGYLQQAEFSEEVRERVAALVKKPFQITTLREVIRRVAA